MFRVEFVATGAFAAFISMPLLPELVSSEVGFCYRHGAPNGAVALSQHSIPPKTARYRHIRLGRRSCDFGPRRS
jgi:hypothetical protein